MPGRVWVVSGPEFVRVANQLREINARLPTEFRKRMRNVARPAVADVKARVRALQLPGGPAGSTGIRRRVARGVTIKASVTGNASLRVATSMADPSEAVIPRGMDTPRGWRHPVFGNTNNWVQQPGSSWFREPLSGYQDEFERGLTQALEWAAETVADAGGARP